MEAQLQIRQEAQEKQNVLNDLLRWTPETQKRSGVKAASRIRPAGPAIPGTQEGLAPLRSRGSGKQSKQESQGFAPNTLRESVKRPINGSTVSAASHTYDKASSKWDTFDYDSALAEADDENGRHKQSFSFPKSTKPAVPSPREPKSAANTGMEQRQQNLPVTPAEPTDAELWKERGNKAFSAKKFAQAKKDYTQSIALQPTCLAYANRAMAELKLDELSAAEADCTEAIALDPGYVKAYLRRAAAAQKLDKLLQAVEDYEYALRLEPTSKSTLAERQTCLHQILQQEGLQNEPARVAIPVGRKAANQHPSDPSSNAKEDPTLGASKGAAIKGSTIKGSTINGLAPSGAADQHRLAPSPSATPPTTGTANQQAPSASQAPTQPAEQQRPAPPQQGTPEPSTSRVPSAAMHTASSHRLPLHRRRAEPSVVIEELPPDEEAPEVPKPRVSSKPVSKAGAQQGLLATAAAKSLPSMPDHAPTAAPDLASALNVASAPNLASAPDVASAPKLASAPKPAPSVSVPPSATTAAAASPSASSVASAGHPQASAVSQASGLPASTSQHAVPSSQQQQAPHASASDTTSPDRHGTAPSLKPKMQGTPSSSSQDPSDLEPAMGSDASSVLHLPEADLQQPTSKAAGSESLPPPAVTQPPAMHHAGKQSSQQNGLHANDNATTPAAAAGPQANGESVGQRHASSVAQNLKAAAAEKSPEKAGDSSNPGLTLPTPRSGSELEVGWKRLKGNAAGQESYLRQLDPMQLPMVFKQSLTTPMLSGIALAALSMIQTQDETQDDHFGMQLLENLKSVPRFDMIVMSLPRREKAALKEQFDAAQNAEVLDSILANRLGTVRRNYRL